MRINSGCYAPKWTADEDAQLIQLVSEGIPFSRIGAVMNKSRNAAIGRAGRLGITAAKRKQPAIYTPPRRVLPKPHVAPPPLPQEPESLRIDLLDIVNGQCRFPQGPFPFYYCGHPVRENAPYCEFHFVLTRQPQHAPRRTWVEPDAVSPVKKALG